ncbi:tyrosine-type recombinase/integrase [Neisseria iguanae]|uniref:tyrosine-type recombinase/integrase n=1 Tax=Neisseria iguanae TaxID=90242 RepID=UPI001FE3492D|nr:hypothetical protein [Neisseria iguanae]
MFPSRVNPDNYASENTAGKIINNMGYKDIATPHGFRALASSTLHEQSFNTHAIEAQLAHLKVNRVNAADYLDERKAFMQWYSAFLRGHYEAAKSAV